MMSGKVGLSPEMRLAVRIRRSEKRQEMTYMKDLSKEEKHALDTLSDVGFVKMKMTQEGYALSLDDGQEIVDEVIMFMDLGGLTL